MKPDTGTYITQEDIDTAFREARQTERISDADEMIPLALDESNIVKPGEETGSTDSDYFGLLSEEDIAALLHGDLAGSSSHGAQDEIDSLVDGAALQKDAPAAKPISPDRKNTSQTDVEYLMQTATGNIEAPGEEAAGTPGTPPPDSSAKGDGVAQDDIDRLLMSALDETGDEAEDEAGIGPAADSPGPESEAVVSQEDINRLLAGETDDEGAEPEKVFEETASVVPETAPEPDEDIDNLISQADLDQLLEEKQAPDSVEAEAASHGAKSPSDYISQDDINRLLKESFEEAEIETEETLDDLVDEEDVPEPVILAEEDAPAEAPPPVLKPKPVRKLRKKVRIPGRKSHLVWAMAAGIVFLVAISVVMMASRSPETPETAAQPKVLTFHVSATNGETSTKSAAYSENSVHFPGFVVLAPPNSASFSYVTADVTLVFSDASIIGVIKENEAFVRDIVYGTISSELMTRNISAIDEVSMELAIRKALGKVIARDAIARIDFDRFSLV